MAVEGEYPQQCSEKAVQRLGSDKELAQVNPVCDGPAPGAKD